MAGNDLGLEVSIGSHQPVKSPSFLAQALISPEIQVKARPQASFRKAVAAAPLPAFPRPPDSVGSSWVPALLQCGGELPAGT